MIVAGITALLNALAADWRRAAAPSARRADRALCDICSSIEWNDALARSTYTVSHPNYSHSLH